MRFNMKKNKVLNTLLLALLLLPVAGTIPAQPSDHPAGKPVKEFTNPILSGFHPDPSICRVGDDYYMVNSSFEWFPGIPIYKSKDLVNWKLIGHGITRPGQADLPPGLPDSRGIYAVTIRHHEGLFYLITTCVQAGGNFYITASDPAGEWSDPVWLGSKGIDPSLFWDDDGKCYYVGHGNLSGTNSWPQQNGAWMQELDLTQRKLVGERTQLTFGHASNARWTEGPHLYKIAGKYMLLVAEGGTGFHHGVTVFHSDSIRGPYIPNHSNPVLTHRHLGKDYPIQAVGHSDLVKTQHGDWWAVALGKRIQDGHCYLSRETFLTPVRFEWQEHVLTPVFNPGIGRLSTTQQRPFLPWTPWEKAPIRDDFDDNKLNLEWNFLRTPLTTWHHCKEGALQIQLRPETADSLVNPSLIARRMEHIKFRIATEMDFRSKKVNEEAGIIIYRTSTAYIQCLRRGNQVVLISKRRGKRTEEAAIPCGNSPKLLLQAVSDGKEVTFSFGPDERNLTVISTTAPLNIISDEEASGFNGPYVGMYASSNGEKSHNKATFNWFDYESK